MQDFFHPHVGCHWGFPPVRDSPLGVGVLWPRWWNYLSRHVNCHTSTAGWSWLRLTQRRKSDANSGLSCCHIAMWQPICWSQIHIWLKTDFMLTIDNQRCRRRMYQAGTFQPEKITGGRTHWSIHWHPRPRSGRIPNWRVSWDEERLTGWQWFFISCNQPDRDVETEVDSDSSPVHILLAQVFSQESKNQTEAYSSPKLKTNCAAR